jgi:hypothetical protein
MSNPGPASTQTDNFLFNGDSTDGIQLAGAATDKLAFHGATPLTKPLPLPTLATPQLVQKLQQRSMQF